MTECNRTHDTTIPARRTADSGLIAPLASDEPAPLSHAESAASQSRRRRAIGGGGKRIERRRTDRKRCRAENGAEDLFQRHCVRLLPYGSKDIGGENGAGAGQRLLHGGL